MEFKNLIEIKSFVTTWNKVHPSYQLEFWFPQMFSIGKWACVIVANPTMDKRYVMEIVSFLYSIQCNFFFEVVNGDLAIDCQ